MAGVRATSPGSKPLRTALGTPLTALPVGTPQTNLMLAGPLSVLKEFTISSNVPRIARTED